MNRSGSLIILFVTLMALTACLSLGRDPLFKLTLKVVDDEGAPVAGAQARIGADRRPKAGESGGKGIFAEGLTDEKGYFSGEVESWDATQAGYSVEKPGHYPVRQQSYSANYPPVSGKWQPWNPTIEVVLKRIKNPVPMYAKYVLAEIPVKDADVGYDLMAGDWVMPYGKGKTSDMVFHGEGEVKSASDYRGVLVVTFPGQGNGLIPFETPQLSDSPLRMPYEAPAEGYESQRQWRSVRSYDGQKPEKAEYIDDSSPTQNFFVRVRTELDGQGGVTKAWYGKIHAPFQFGARGMDPLGRTKRQLVIFTYYLNPDGTRNIEYDSKRNLLKSPRLHDRDYEDLAP